MKATATTVHRLVQGPKLFLIPTFQRRYTWKKEQWAQLWTDLVGESQVQHPNDPDNHHGHFLGSVVLHPAPGPTSTLMRHQVIDGQQRLTTILVLLAAMRDYRRAEGDTSGAEAIDAQYLLNPYSVDSPDRIVPTKLDREAYVSTVRLNEPTADMGIAYNFFLGEISKLVAGDLATLDLLQDTLLLNMLIVEINTKSGDSVNSIFNTLNSKGMDLSPADLVRNEILHHIGDLAADEAHERFWIPMEQGLVNARAKSPDREFVTFLWSREVALDPKTSRDALFPAFERRLRSHLSSVRPEMRSQAACAVLEEMYADHGLFRIIRDPWGKEIDSRVPGEVLEVLRDLREWRSEPATPIALWVLKHVVEGAIDAGDAAEALRTLLSYLVKRTLHGVPTNQLNRLLTPVASDLGSRAQGQPVAAKMRSTLSKQGYYWPTDGQVLASVATNPIYASARRYTSFLLHAAEADLRPHGEIEDWVFPVGYVVPAVLPQPWIDEIQAHGEDLADVQALTNTLGNLTLFEEVPSRSPESFGEEREDSFAASSLGVNSDLRDLEYVTARDIEERSVRLARAIIRKFPYSPMAGAPVFSSDDSGASAAERLESLLQTIAVGEWVAEDDLVTVLAAQSQEVREIVNSMDATLARLVRAEDGTVPQWLGVELRQEVVRQDAVVTAGERISRDELARVVASGSDVDEESALDEPSHP